MEGCAKINVKIWWNRLTSCSMGSSINVYL